MAHEVLASSTNVTANSSSRTDCLSDDLHEKLDRLAGAIAALPIVLAELDARKDL